MRHQLSRQDLSPDCLQNEGVKRPKKDGERVILTTGGLRRDGVPVILELVCVISPSHVIPRNG